MKFSKTLREELLEPWRAQYINYKMLKKVLKLEKAQAIPTFCHMLESELRKVHEFILEQQEDLCQVLSKPVSRSPTAWEQIVKSIQQIQAYIALNSTAVRKIIKKFEKHLRVAFNELVPLVRSQLLVDATSIGAWLLAPAQQCLRLAQAPEGARQFNFWVQELCAGAMLARSRMSGHAAAKMRLQLTCGEDLQCRIRNTFIDVSLKCCDREVRARSLPPRLEAEVPLIALEPTGALKASPMAAAADGSWDEPGDWAWDGEETPKPSEHWPEERAWQEKTWNDKASKWPAEAFSGQERTVERVVWEAKGKGACKGAATSRWWTDSLEACPICGFPIRLLPYPPFKLQADRQPTLVDGPYVVLQVLSTWNFEVMGHTLTAPDIKALDMYMKRCKLGPFRLGRALELFNEPSREAKNEFENLRSRAKRRLEGLKHIQRVRMNKLDMQEQGETPSGSLCQAQEQGRQRRRQWGKNKNANSHT